MLSSNVISLQGLNNFLNDSSQVIRIYSNVGAAFGNQAANANLIRRIRSLGYQGKFEFIYPRVIRDKIQALFNLPDVLPSAFSASGIVFTTIEEHIQRYLDCKLPPVKLAMAGAWDELFTFETPVILPDIEMIESLSDTNLEKFEEDNIVSINFANLMNANVFIRFSQYQTAVGHFRYSDTVFQLKDRLQNVKQYDSGKKLLVTHPYTLADANNYFHTTDGKQLHSMKPGLTALLDAYNNENIKLMPCYGYTLLNGSPDNLIAMAAAARAVQQQRYANYTIIMPFFNALDKYAEEELRFAFQFKLSEALREEVIRYDLESVVIFASIDDVNSIELLVNPPLGKVIVVTTGQLPQIVFDALYTHSGSNVLMQVREGASSFASLIHTGRPHFRCGGSWELGFEGIKDERVKQHLSNAAMVCNPMDDDWSRVNISEVVKDYILDAQNPNSSLSAYFRNLKLKSELPENDRIVTGLNTGVNLLDAAAWSGLLSKSDNSISRISHCRNSRGMFMPDQFSNLDVDTDLPSDSSTTITSLALIFFMLLLAWRARSNVNYKYHKSSQILFARRSSDMKEDENTDLKHICKRV